MRVFKWWGVVLKVMSIWYQNHHTVLFSLTVTSFKIKGSLTPLPPCVPCVSVNARRMCCNSCALVSSARHVTPVSWWGLRGGLVVCLAYSHPRLTMNDAHTHYTCSPSLPLSHLLTHVWAHSCLRSGSDALQRGTGWMSESLLAVFVLKRLSVWKPLFPQQQSGSISPVYVGESHGVNFWILFLSSEETDHQTTFRRLSAPCHWTFFLSEGKFLPM